MNNNSIYVQQNKERLQEQAQNCYHQQGGKEKAAEYYDNNKERLHKQAQNKYRELSNEEKDTKKEYGRNRYRNSSKEDKQILREYEKTIVKQRKCNSKEFFFFFLYIV